jgi:hypothetical protein
LFGTGATIVPELAGRRGRAGGDEPDRGVGALGRWALKGAGEQPKSRQGIGHPRAPGGPASLPSHARIRTGSVIPTMSRNSAANRSATTAAPALIGMPAFT